VPETLLSKGVAALLAKGVISPAVLNSLVAGAVWDGAPALESLEFAALLDRINELRRGMYAHLVAALPGGPWEVVHRRWLDEREVFLSGGSSSNSSSGPSPGPCAGPVLRSVDAILDSVLQTVLAQVGLARGGGCSGSGSGSQTKAEAEEKEESAEKDAGAGVSLTDAGRMVAGSGADFLPALVYLHVLLSGGLFTCQRLSLVAPDGSTFVTASRGEDRDVRTLARVASLLAPTARPRPEAWSGLIERDAAAFQVLVKAVQRAVRFAAEAALVALFHSGRVDAGALSADQYAELARRLPFGADPSASLGVAALSYFGGQSSPADLAAAFPQLSDLGADMSRFRQLWPLAVALAEPGSDAEHYMRSAGEFLAAFVPKQ
jgi:hypothetical protein